MAQSDLSYRFPRELAGTVLEQIVTSRTHELAGARLKWPAESIASVLDRAPQISSFRRALSRGTPAIIAELKKASPSAGVLHPAFHPVALALELERSGAAAFSVVTEVQHFQGSLENLASLRWRTKLPLLRKDFIIDRYQVLEARHAGADAVLLIAALLDDPLMTALREDAERLGMDALVEVHNGKECERALACGATLIGVNNRDLRTFEVSLETCVGLAGRFPEGVIAVAESGLRSAEDIRRLWDAGYSGFLVGEHLMRAPSPGAALEQLIPRAVPARRRSS